MINQKHKFAILCLLTFFILGKFFVLLHSFSHSNQPSNLILSENKNFIEKIIFSHDKNKSHKNFDDCVLCSFSNLQNQIFLTDNIFFFSSFFILIFALRFYNFSKLSYLLTSKLSRAPPFIS